MTSAFAVIRCFSVGDFPIGFGRYQLVERLAVGGMAELFVATSPGEHGFQKKVVIKRLLPHLVDGRHLQRDVHRRGEADRAPRPPEDRADVRARPGRRRAVHRDGVRRRHRRARAAPRVRARRRRVEPQLAAWIAHEVLDALDYAHNLARRGRPPARHRPSRHLAVERAAVACAATSSSSTSASRARRIPIARTRARPARSRASTATCRPSR